MENFNNLFDEIVFNDADGSDIDMDQYYYTMLYNGVNNSWEDITFFVYAGEWNYRIIYDDLEEDVRYSVSIHDDYPGSDKKTIIHYSKAFRDESPKSKDIILYGEEYNLEFFLDYKDKEIQSSSIIKFRKIIKQILNLKAFL